MFIYYASIIGLIDETDRECRLILEEIGNLEDPSAADFADRIKNLDKLASDKLSQPPLSQAPCAGDLQRHLSFAVHFSAKKPSIPYIQSNLRDVVVSDAPAIRKGLADYMESFMDADLLQATKKRLQNSDYLGAVRAAFPLFSGRMRTSFGIDAKVKDGAKLIDAVFRPTTIIKYRSGTVLTDREKNPSIH